MQRRQNMQMRQNNCRAALRHLAHLKIGKQGGLYYMTGNRKKYLHCENPTDPVLKEWIRQARSVAPETKIKARSRSLSRSKMQSLEPKRTAIESETKSRKKTTKSRSRSRSRSLDRSRSRSLARSKSRSRSRSRSQSNDAEAAVLPEKKSAMMEPPLPEPRPLTCRVPDDELFDEVRRTLGRLAPPPKPGMDPCEYLTELLMQPMTRSFYTSFQSVRDTRNEGEFTRGQVVRILGAGRNATVVLCELSNGSRVALKTGVVGKDEFQLQLAFANRGLAPRPIAVRRTTWTQMTMEPIDGTLASWLLDDSRTVEDATRAILAVKVLLQDLQAAKMTHGDMNLNNVAYRIQTNTATGRTESRLLLIDFGTSSTKGSFTLLEMMQLLRGAWFTQRKFIHEQNARLSYVKSELNDPSNDRAFANVLWREERHRAARHTSVIRSILRVWKQTFWGLMWNEYPETMSEMFGSVETMRHETGFLSRLTAATEELGRQSVRKEMGELAADVDLSKDGVLASLVLDI